MHRLDLFHGDKESVSIDLNWTSIKNKKEKNKTDWESIFFQKEFPERGSEIRSVIIVS